MFAAIRAFFAMIATMFEAGNRGANSLNNFAKLGEVKSMQFLQDEIVNSGIDLTTLKQNLIDIGLDEAPKSTQPVAKRVTKASV